MGPGRRARHCTWRSIGSISIRTGWTKRFNSAPWKRGFIRNSSSHWRQFHIHVNDFQDISVDGVAVRSHGWQDRVALAPNSKTITECASTTSTESSCTTAIYFPMKNSG